MMLSLGDQQNWATKVRELLYKYNFSHLWDNQFVQNERAFLNELKERLVQEYCNYWYQSLLNSERYTFYRQFKTSLTTESYLSYLDRKPFRDVFIQFRSGFSELYEHKYRFRDSENLFVCPACRETFECELHFLFSCPVYDDLRNKYLSYAKTTTNWNIANAMGTVNCTDIRQLATYLYHAFKRRQEAVATEFFSADDI